MRIQKPKHENINLMEKIILLCGGRKNTCENERERGGIPKIRGNGRVGKTRREETQKRRTSRETTRTRKQKMATPGGAARQPRPRAPERRSRTNVETQLGVRRLLGPPPATGAGSLHRRVTITQGRDQRPHTMPRYDHTGAFPCQASSTGGNFFVVAGPTQSDTR